VKTVGTLSSTIPSKKEILLAAMASHESVMQDFRNRIREMQANEVDENVDGPDKYSASHGAETIAEMRLLEEQLEFASHEWEELVRIESYHDDPHDKVEFGSVVVTDRRTFFVSASIEEFKVGDYVLFGLSVHTPLYKAMKGRRRGESFQYGGTTYFIKGVF
jgi:hypothetical protein